MMMNETVMLSGLARQLVDAQLLAEAAAQQAVVKAKQAKVPLVTYLVQQRLVQSRPLAELAAQEFGVPFLDLSAIDITLDQGLLSVSGERVKDVAAKDVERSRTERPHGRFHRRFTLPDTVDAANVQASGRNGIVEVTIPKQPKAQPRRIQIAVS